MLWDQEIDQVTERIDKSRVVVSFRDVHFAYDGEPVIRDATVDVYTREFVSIVGPNGGGKSTLVKLLLGLLKPNRGTVQVLGASPAEARTRIGYMPQRAHLDPQFPATVMDVVLMGRLNLAPRIGPYRAVDRQAARDALARVELPDLESRPFSALSGGQRQRALIARALVADPELLVLDEPTANLDVQVEFKLYDLLKELNQDRTVILVSHDLGFVSRYVDSVICVNRGVEVHPTHDLDAQKIQDIYGAELRLVRHDHRCGEDGHQC
jgi:zinc transport system ATP-binding protein